MIRVLIVDDDALVRSGLRIMLTGAANVDVVAEAADGREVLAAVDLHRPDVVLMDIRMPQLDGIAATGCWPRSPTRQPSSSSRRSTATSLSCARCRPEQPASCSRTPRRRTSSAQSSSSTPATACSPPQSRDGSSPS